MPCVRGDAGVEWVGWGDTTGQDGKGRERQRDETSAFPQKPGTGAGGQAALQPQHAGAARPTDIQARSAGLKCKKGQV